MFEEEAEAPVVGWLEDTEAEFEELSELAETIAGLPSEAGFEFEKPKPRWTRCFSKADVERVRTVYKDNATAAAANSIDRCSCIVMLNVALGELLRLKKKQHPARGKSTRRVWMAPLTTKKISLAMAQLVRSGHARPSTKIDFYDRRNRTAGTLKPEKLKRSVQKAVLDLTVTKGCWYAFGLSVFHDYHSVLLLVDKTGADAKIYWLDQFSSDIDDDVTTTLDQRITDKTRSWWQAVKDKKNVGYNTTVRIWPLRKRK